MRNPDTIARRPNGEFDNDASHSEPTGLLMRTASEPSPAALTDVQRANILKQRTAMREEADMAQARVDAIEMHLLADDLGRVHPGDTHVFVARQKDNYGHVELYGEFGEVNVLGVVRPGGRTPSDDDLAARIALLSERNGSMFHTMLVEHEAGGRGVPIAELASAGRRQMQMASDRFRAGERADEQQVSDVVLRLAPNAVSWTVGVVEYDNGYFYDPDGLYAKNADGAEVHIDTDDDELGAGREARDQLYEALASMGDRDGPLGEQASHEGAVR